MYSNLKTVLQRVAVSNIRLYAFVRSNVGRFGFLLPHDSSFYAFKKLGGGRGIFLDVGANDGISARSYRKLVPNRPIVSIEPNPHHEASLLRVEKSIEDFSFMLIGAGEANGELVLHTPIYKGFALTNYASLDPESARKNLERHMNIRNIGKNSKFSENRIPIKRLDELNFEPAIIKIDVEGFEDMVISGLRDTIIRAQPLLMIEYNQRSFSTAKTIMTELEYTAKSYDVSSDKFVAFNETTPSLNVFFLPKNATYS
ncbi:FkbM family methyltransferase [Dyella ginsengisoli]|uniref:FkbM family methyltransferase n=1 Tax=Dyella ginsengisoli TaxID=363848 RepID=A0ABW8JWU6_9GAMM